MSTSSSRAFALMSKAVERDTALLCQTGKVPSIQDIQTVKDLYIEALTACFDAAKTEMNPAEKDRLRALTSAHIDRAEQLKTQLTMTSAPSSGPKDDTYDYSIGAKSSSSSSSGSISWFTLPP